MFDSLGKCRVSEAEKSFDHRNGIVEAQQRIEYLEKRTEVIELAGKFLAGKPVKIELHDRPYSQAQMFEDVALNDDFEKAVIAAYQDDPQLMKELVLKVVRHRACEYLYFDESSQLGFEL